MKQLIKILATAIALVAAIVTHAQETVSFSPEDLELLRQLACEENSDRLPLEPPVAEINTLSSSKIFAVDNSRLSPESTKSAYTEAVQIESELKTEKSIEEFCADYQVD